LGGGIEWGVSLQGTAGRERSSHAAEAELEPLARALMRGIMTHESQHREESREVSDAPFEQQNSSFP